MRKISVVISSLRPDRLEETIDTIEPHSDLAEVVVVSPTPPKPREFVRHVPVAAPGEPGELSFTQKFNLAVENASCEYIAFNNDDLHFNSGWAPALVNQMEKRRKRPYLAAFHLSVGGKVHTRYTAFGMLYANLGCVRKSDLKYIGGKLFDERYYMYTSDIDLGLRVWAAGGRVEICQEVVLNADRDVDQVAISKKSKFATEKSKSRPRTYRDEWFDHDNTVFMKTWFPKYFWLFFKNYPWLKEKLSNEDGVLPLKRYQSGLLKIMLWPVFNMYINPKIVLTRRRKLEFIRKHWVRVINRRWREPAYRLPYPEEAVLRKG